MFKRTVSLREAVMVAVSSLALPAFEVGNEGTQYLPV